jgi:hypothetical protein
LIPALNGWIDDVRVYNRVLTDGEIAALAAGTQPATGLGSCALGANLNVAGDLTLHSGTLVQTSPFGINVGGSWLNNGGRFTYGNGLVTFNGTGVSNQILSGGQPFGNVDVTGTGTWACQDNFSTDGNFNKTNGGFIAPSGRMKVAGAFGHLGGTFTHNSGTVVFNSVGSRTINPNGVLFNRLVVTDGADGLVGLWNFDETAGPIAKDVVGANNLTYGTAPANPTPDPDVPNVPFVDPRSLSFDGIDDSAVGSVDGIPNGNAAHSVAAWIKIGALPATRSWILSLGHQNYGPHHWLVKADGSMQLGLGFNATMQFTPTLPLGTWKHVALTYNGTNLNYYLDGSFVGRSPARPSTSRGCRSCWAPPASSRRITSTARSTTFASTLAP